MADDIYRLPNEIATELDLSPSTLRRWSNEFADFLSDLAGRPEPEPGSKMAHRRYTDQDLEVLRTVKSLLSEGMTYVQVARRLEARALRHDTRRGEAEHDTPGRAPQAGTALAATWSEAGAAAPAVSVLADTLHTVADGQQLLLGSQQANRELLSVVLQDNFSLKEENAKLRDRMIELERDMVEMRRVEESRRDKLETRLQRLEDYARRVAVQAPATERPGCLAQIFGPLT
ncbi:MAG: MerR family transcriptional regulator [Anaerolineae bacterium]|nr:MerR family transcriptional regulator [Anaerolineae bacterium]